MQKTIFLEIEQKILELEKHPLYEWINSKERLCFFMERHVYAVWDFMCLTKTIQNEFAPIPNDKRWQPPRNRELARFINEIIVAEESDETPSGEVMSHFEIYLKAMTEVGASIKLVEALVAQVTKDNFSKLALKLNIPFSSKKFSEKTLETIDYGHIHQIAASFCFGREKSIPHIFRSLLEKMAINESDAPMFHYYLKRHIEIDGDNHGPIALKMIESLCADDETKWREVKESALKAIKDRYDFWSDVLAELQIIGVGDFHLQKISPHKFFH